MAVDIEGFCDDRFRPLEDAFRANFEDDLELGASLGVTWQGAPVVDLWGGYANVRRTRPWERDTVVLVYSTTKIMANLAILMLVDRGSIDLDTAVAAYWPEFAQGGKAAVTVRDVLTHQAGIPAFEPPVALEALRDWNAMTAQVAAQPHSFGGRKVVCYHPVTYGFVVGELIRRVDGRSPGRFFREEVALKAGADFHLSLSSDEDFARLAALKWQPEPASFWASDFAAKVDRSVGPGVWTSREQLGAEIPGSSGVGNGRSIARVCAILAMGGELDGVRYLSRRTVEEAAREQAAADDPMMGPIRYGLGFGLDSIHWPAPSSTSFHWGGVGGSWGLMDLQGLSLGYAPNNMISTPGLDPRLERFVDALRQLLPSL